MTTKSARARAYAGFPDGARRGPSSETSASHRERRMADKVAALEVLEPDELGELCEQIRADRGLPDDTFAAMLHDMAEIDQQASDVTRLPGPADPSSSGSYPAELVSRIVADIDGGLGWSSVAKALNDEGSRNASGAPWIPARVMQVYQRAKSPRQKRRCSVCGRELPDGRGRPRTRCVECTERRGHRTRP